MRIKRGKFPFTQDDGDRTAVSFDTLTDKGFGFEFEEKLRDDL